MTIFYTHSTLLIMAALFVFYIRYFKSAARGVTLLPQFCASPRILNYRSL